MSKLIFHIDVNSAYLSWEAAYRLQQGEELDLRTIPSVVGGDEESRHGIVLTKSIPAKKFNIQTGETLNKAIDEISLKYGHKAISRFCFLHSGLSSMCGGAKSSYKIID